LADSEPDWDEFIRKLAEELLREMNRQLFRRYGIQLRRLRSPSEKLIYEHLIYNQPRTFTIIKRELDLSKPTAIRTMKRLKARGAIFQDENFLFWVKETEPQNAESSPRE